METLGLNEALDLYLTEVKDSNQEIDYEEEPVVLNEVELATDFLQKVGLGNLTKTYQQGKEITESMVNDSVRQRHLTEKQAETIKTRVRTLNKTLHNRQSRRKPRQDVRDVAWNVETSSTGTRSRSATPDSLDSIDILNDDLTSDEDQQLPPSISQLDAENVSKEKVKWTFSEPVSYKVFSRSTRGNVAHLGSDNVVLKGYQPLDEPSPTVIPHRERSGSDPTTEVLQLFGDYNIPPSLDKSSTLHSQRSHSHHSLLVVGASASIESKSDSYQNTETEKLTETKLFNIDDLTDSECQHLKPLLWVEVTAVFDSYKISVFKRKASTKSKKANVFGVNLSTLVMRDMPTHFDKIMVPQIFSSIIYQLNSRCLNEDGILRVAGQKQRLDFLCNEIEEKFYNSRASVESLLSQSTAHDLVGILKKLLRELPDPIFTTELIDMFYKCTLIPSSEDQFKALNLLILLLPVEHRSTCRLLFRFFKNIYENEKRNRMSLYNVALITTPSFFLPKLLFPKKVETRVNLKNITKEELTKQVNDAAMCCRVMELLLASNDALFNVPPDLAMQAQESHRKAQDRKDFGKDRKTQPVKKKLQRSITQYESGSQITSRIKRDFCV